MMYLQAKVKSKYAAHHKIHHRHQQIDGSMAKGELVRV